MVERKHPERASVHREINIEDYDYDLPDERIAKYPLAHRDESKLLVYKDGEMSDSRFFKLPEYIPSGSLMVFNNSKVIQARMHFRKTTGARIEIFCLEPYDPNDYAVSFQQNERCCWICLVGNLKKWKDGKLHKTLMIGEKNIKLSAQRKEALGDSHIIEFSWDENTVTFADILDTIGELPIPPYLNRETEEKDKQTYQTIYSKIKGSVAAPTAGLHFTDRVFADLNRKSIEREEVTLHVGAGTFKPVKANNIDEHVMHSEFISVKRSVIEHLLKNKGPIIAVGTTTVRTLESLYYLGEIIGKDKENPQLKVLQNMPYEKQWSKPYSAQKALRNILDYLEHNNFTTLIAETQIIIKPGYTFQIVDGIITNFHQPKSTLLLLVSAFLSDNITEGALFDEWKKIYSHALDNGYRFLSYGDSSLLLGKNV